MSGCTRGSGCVVNGSSAVAGISVLLMNIHVHVLGECSAFFGEMVETTQRKIGTRIVPITSGQSHIEIRSVDTTIRGLALLANEIQKYM